jgi:hypothetical protein
MRGRKRSPRSLRYEDMPCERGGMLVELTDPLLYRRSVLVRPADTEIDRISYPVERCDQDFT